MAYDFDSYLQKKGISEASAPAARPTSALDAVADRIEEAEAQDQGYSLDEYRDLKRKSQEYSEKRRSQKKEKGFGDYAEDVVRGVADQPFLRSFTKGATAGLSEPVAAGLSSLILKGMGEDASVKDVYSDVAGNQREDLERMAAENPWQTAGGEIAGLAAPGGVFGRLFGAAGKAAPKLATEGAPLAQRLGAKALEAGTRGGLANLGYGAVKEASSEALGQDEKWNPAMDFGLGAAGDIAALPAEKALQVLGSSKNIKNFVEGIPGLGGLAKGGREEAESAAKKTFENAKESYRAGETERMMRAEADAIQNQRKSVEDFKNLIQENPTASAQKLFGKLKSVDAKIGKEYGDVVDPIMSKYRLRKVDATPFQAEVDNILNRFGVIDEAGQVDPKSMEGFLDFDPESKDLVNKLVSFKDGLTGDTSISKLERGVKALQKAAKFQKGTGYRSGTEETLGDLSRRLKDFMTDQISAVASPDEVAAIQGAKAKFAEAKNALKEPLKVIGRYESKPARIAANLRSQFPDTTMQNLMKLDPSLKDEFGELFLNNLTSQSVSPRKFTKEIDYFGGGESGSDNSRDLLKNILGEERFSQLEGAEKNLHEAAVPWKKKYTPAPPPQLADIPPGQIEEIYDLLSGLARAPGKIKNGLGAGASPQALSMLAPFLSPRLQEQLSQR